MTGPRRVIAPVRSTTTQAGADWKRRIRVLKNMVATLMHSKELVRKELGG